MAARSDSPRWWLLAFLIACVGALGYWIHAHSAAGEPDGDNPDTTTTSDMLVAMSQDADAVAAGKALYVANCAVCHLATGAGLTGPNLTDKYWIHGGKPMDIHRVIARGVPTKGMVPWEPMLGPHRTRQVTAYVLTQKNTDVAGKGPEGELEKNGN